MCVCDRDREREREREREAGICTCSIDSIQNHLIRKKNVDVLDTKTPSWYITWYLGEKRPIKSQQVMITSSSPSVLGLLVETDAANRSVWVIQQLKQTLIDHIFRYVHHVQGNHVLE